MRTVVVYGPQACGKTRNKAFLLKFLHCLHVVDDWRGDTPLVEGDLALTTVSPPYDRFVTETYSFGALKDAGLPLD